MLLFGIDLFSFRGWMWLCKKLELNASYSLSALSCQSQQSSGKVRNGTFLKIIYWSLCTREKSRKPAMSRKCKCTGVSLHCIEDVCCSSLRNHCWGEKGETGGATERKPRKKKDSFPLEMFLFESAESDRRACEMKTEGLWMFVLWFMVSLFSREIKLKELRRRDLAEVDDHGGAAPWSHCNKI